jgi:hypothetical protein
LPPRSVTGFDPVNFFSFFTIVSNVFGAVILLVTAFGLIAGQHRSDVLRGAATRRRRLVDGSARRVRGVHARSRRQVHWYPYPFVDADAIGYAHVAAYLAAILVSSLAVGWVRIANGNTRRARRAPVRSGKGH